MSKKKNKKQKMIRVGKVALNDVLPYAVPREEGVRAEKPFLDKAIYMDSHRYLTFANKGCTCSQCGLDGKYFAVERAQNTNNNPDRFHLNLYGLGPNGDEILMCAAGRKHEERVPLCKQCVNVMDKEKQKGKQCVN